jgi:hypothetical protein
MPAHEIEYVAATEPGFRKVGPDREGALIGGKRRPGAGEAPVMVEDVAACDPRLGKGRLERTPAAPERMRRRHERLPRDPGFGQFRLGHQGAIERDGSGGGAAQELERLRLVVMRSGKIRLQGNSSIEVRDRVLEAGQIVQDGPAIVPHFRIRGTGGQRLVEGVQRLQRSLQVLEDGSVVVEDLRRAQAAIDRLTDVTLRLRMPADLRQQNAELVERLAVRRMPKQKAFEKMLGAGEISRLGCRDGPLQAIVILAEVGGQMRVAGSGKGHLAPTNGGTGVGRPVKDQAALRSLSRSTFCLIAVCLSAPLKYLDTICLISSSKHVINAQCVKYSGG